MENGKNIEKVKSSISNANSYEEIGEFWDEHDTAECWEDTYPVEFTINLKDDEDIVYYGIDEALSQQIISLSQEKGITARELVNSWLKEILQETTH